MKSQRSKLVVAGLAVALLGVAPAMATVTVTVDPGAAWIGYMNIFGLPIGSGTYEWGSAWGTPDLPATFSGNVLTIGPNTNTYNAADPYWVNPSTLEGNKWCNASFYVEDDTLVNEEVEFGGFALENSLVAPFQSRAFIKVFDAGYALLGSAYADLTTGQPFSLSLLADNANAAHVQYGFETDSVPCDPATVASKGLVRVVPEPSSLILGLALAGLAVIRRR